MGYLDMPEKELVRRAVAGDQMAYRAIYQLHESGKPTWTTSCPKASRKRL